MDINLEKRLARLLLREAYRDEECRLSFDRKSDYSFDNSSVSHTLEGQWLLGTIFSDILCQRDINCVAGICPEANPLVSAITKVSQDNGKPLHSIFVRHEIASDQKYVEGIENIPKGMRVALVDNVVTFGDKMLQATQIVKDCDLEVASCMCILDREEGGRRLLEKCGFELLSLFTQGQLLIKGRNPTL